MKTNTKYLFGVFFAAALAALFLFQGSVPEQQALEPEEKTHTQETSAAAAPEPESKKAEPAAAGSEQEQLAEEVASPRSYTTTFYQTEPLVLSGQEELLIEDTHWIQENDIVLEGNARLVIRDSFFDHRKEYGFQYELKAQDNSTVVIEDSQLANECNGSLNWNFFDSSSLHASNVEQAECNIWVLATNEAAASVAGWDWFGGTTCDNASLFVENSKDLEIELCNARGVDMDIELPVDIDEYEFSGNTVPGMTNSIVLRNATIDGWGIGASFGDNITVRNGHAVTVSFGVGLPYQGETVVLENLGKQYYQDRTWDMDQGSIRLLNTTVYGWETSAWAGGHTLIIKDSTFTGPTLNSGASKVIVENSTVDTANSYESVEVTLIDSVVKGDVIARDDSTITLVRTAVEGRIIQEGNGKIIVQE